METNKKNIAAAIATKIEEAKTSKVADRFNGMKKCVTVSHISARKYHVGFRFTAETNEVGMVEKSACGRYNEEIKWAA